LIIDAHTHILPPEVISHKKRFLQQDSTFKNLFSNNSSNMRTADELIESMDLLGIEKSAILGMGWKDDGFNSFINDYIIESSEKYSERLIPITGINPSSQKIGLYEAERCLSLGSRGFGELHPHHQDFDISDINIMKPYMELLATYNYPLILHVSEPVGHTYPGKGDTLPSLVENFIRHFPESLMILSHWGGGLPFYELMPEIKLLMKNIYYDCAASTLIYDKNIFNIVPQLISPRKILFGSDFPLLSQNNMLSMIKNSDPTNIEKTFILYQNACDVFNITSQM
jgi:predicted TIM-barrel fold metal-dependent hydrolase